MRSGSPWLHAALLLGGGLVLAWLMSGLASASQLGLLSHMGVMALITLSLNLLLGQGGMLSFGHAIYVGTGVYLGVAFMRGLPALGGAAWGLALMPLTAGLGALLLALPLGWLCTRREGTPLAMLTFGLGELVSALALMWPAVFGGDAGWSADRVAAGGGGWASATTVFFVVVMYVSVGALVLWLGVRSSWGLRLRAVRDNPMRAAYLGLNPTRWRWGAFVLAAFLAGVAGGLLSLLTELASPEVFSAERSGLYLLLTVLGGRQHFAGPVLGAVVGVWFSMSLSALTPAWLLYLGLLLAWVLLLAPGGLAGAWLLVWRQARQPGLLQHGLWRLAALWSSAAAALGGLVVMVELLYQRQHQSVLGPVWSVATWSLPLDSSSVWAGCLWVMLVGGGLWVFVWRQDVPFQAVQAATPARQLSLMDGGMSDTPVPLAPGPEGLAVHVRAVSLHRSGVRLLDDVDLLVPAGQALALVGPNGAGKSTLLDVVSGRQCADCGQVELGANVLRRPEPHQMLRLGLARSFQHSQLFAGLDVQAHVYCALLGAGHVGDLERSLAHWLDALSLRAVSHATVAELTYAQQRWLDLGMALVSGAPVLLLDEPSAGLNAAQLQQLLHLLQAVRGQRTLLIVEHDMHVVKELDAEMAVMVHGQILLQGDVDTVRAHPQVQQLYWGQGGANAAA